jgi:hypothetical protein
VRKVERLALINAIMDRLQHEYDVIADIFSEQCATMAKQDIIDRAIAHGDDNDFGFSNIADEHIGLSFEQRDDGFTVRNDAGDEYVFQLTKIVRKP